MAITPDEASRMTEAEATLADDLEDLIDQHLRAKYEAKGKIYYHLPPQVSLRVRQEVMRRYEAAGWRVTYECDQRDGDNLGFTPKPAEPAKSAHVCPRHLNDIMEEAARCG
jgi:hypothetical protein